MNPLGSAQLAAAGSRNSQTGNRAQGAVFAVASVKVHIFRVLVHAYPDTDGLTVTTPSMTFRLQKSAEFQVHTAEPPPQANRAKPFIHNSAP
jgi:hypothetical protein